MSISMLAAIVAKQDELYKKPANIAAMMKWSDKPAVREWGLRLENALLREKTESVTNCNQLKMREAVAETEKRIDKVISILTEIPDSCGYGGLLEDAADELCDLKEEFVKPALSEPPRNCDRQYKNGYDVLGEFTAKTGRQIFETADVVNWLFAEAKKECEEKE